VVGLGGVCCGGGLSVFVLGVGFEVCFGSVVELVG